MISGEFSGRGELSFEIALMGADAEPIPVNAILDTGFTGWLIEEIVLDNLESLC